VRAYVRAHVHAYEQAYSTCTHTCKHTCWHTYMHAYVLRTETLTPREKVVLFALHVNEQPFLCFIVVLCYFHVRRTDGSIGIP